jgi:hypothetical protein
MKFFLLFKIIRAKKYLKKVSAKFDLKKRTKCTFTIELKNK